MTQKLVKLTKKITNHDHSSNYITSKEFKKLTADNFALRLKQANLPSKNEYYSFFEKEIFRWKTEKLTQKSYFK